MRMSTVWTLTFSLCPVKHADVAVNGVVLHMLGGSRVSTSNEIAFDHHVYRSSEY